MATILIVDDNPANREYLVTLLGYGGHHLLEAGDGAEALDKAKAEHPDLIIADIVMPTMDGFEFVHQLRSDPAIAAIEVVFYTATYHEREARALAHDCGVRHILTKPAEPQAVLDVIHLALNGSAAPPAPAAPEAFDREHLRLMSDKLSQKVTELETVGLRLAALLDLGQRLAAERDPHRLLNLTGHAARELIGAAHAAIGLLAEDQRSVGHFELHGLSPEQAGRLSKPALDRGVVFSLIAERKPLRRHNPAGDPGALGLPADHPPPYSFLGAPIASPARVYGWLDLRNKLGADEFSEEDERLAVTLAAQTAVAYENILRYAEIQRHADELEQRVNERTAELRRSNAELEQFAYVASHDLQEPLRKIVSYTQLLAQRYQGRLDADADEFIGFTVNSAARLRQLIQDLLAFSRVGWKQKALAPIDCEAVLRRALDNLHAAIEEGGAQVTHDPLPEPLADPDQLVQLFQNLIGNAIKFRGSRPPHVHVSARLCDPPPETGNPQADIQNSKSPEWLFAVRDNGIGLEMQYAERIFNVFQRLHAREDYPGTGIGLAICKKVVERHGGRIWVESAPGQGTTFYFTLPAQPPPDRQAD